MQPDSPSVLPLGAERIVRHGAAAASEVIAHCQTRALDSDHAHHSPAVGPSRPAFVVHAEIRALLQETGGWLWGPTRERYEALRDEWVEAVRGEMTTAA